MVRTHTHTPTLLSPLRSFSLAYNELCRGSLGHEYEYERDGEMDAALEDGQFGDEDEARDRVYFDTISGNIVSNLETSTESDNWSVDGGATAKVTGGRMRSSSTASNPGITDDERARARKFRTGSFNGSRTGKPSHISTFVHLPSFADDAVSSSSFPLSMYSRPCVHRSYFGWRLCFPSRRIYGSSPF